jgi:Zn ribbon nucleic-acid-binding protein
MATIEFQELPRPGDEKLILVNGKRYVAGTGERCPQCAFDDRYLFIKMKLNGSEVVLECPYCETYTTKPITQVNLKLGH